MPITWFAGAGSAAIWSARSSSEWLNNRDSRRANAPLKNARSEASAEDRLKEYEAAARRVPPRSAGVITKLHQKIIASDFPYCARNFLGLDREQILALPRQCCCQARNSAATAAKGTRPLTSTARSRRRAADPASLSSFQDSAPAAEKQKRAAE